MITIKELKEHCERQLNKLPKGSKTYEEHLLTLNIIETLKEKDKYIKHSEEITTDMNEDINKLLSEIEEKDKQIEKVLDLIFEYGQIDGGHHKAWVIDQILKILTKDKYDEWVKNYVYDEETGDTYSWDKGIAP